uniref:Uncharacterized protein n=1 Tax=Anguilla anguilla TaxID=7936 RepID=A0A0E9T2I5_ANGAN
MSSKGGTRWDSYTQNCSTHQIGLCFCFLFLLLYHLLVDSVIHVFSLGWLGS